MREAIGWMLIAAAFILLSCDIARDTIDKVMVWGVFFIAGAIMTGGSRK